MEIRQYLRMLRRGWPVIVFVTLLGLGLAATFLAISPKRFESTAVVIVTVATTGGASDLESGRQYAVSVAPTFADVIRSPRVLQPVASELSSWEDETALQDNVTAVARDSTSLIDITVATDDAESAAATVNKIADEASAVVPSTVGRAGRSSTSDIRLEVISKGSAPTSAVAPNPKRVLAIGFIVGVGVGVALMVLRQALDTRLRQPEDLRAASTIPLLGALPRPKRSGRGHLVVRDDPTSPAVEAYRAVRTNLVHLESTEHRSLLATAVRGRDDGRVVLNLAWSLAQAGRRVLLVDLDLRQSAVAQLLNIEEHKGIADVLLGTSAFEDVVRDTEQRNLWAVGSGTTQGSPSDLLSSPLVAHVIRLAEQHYDVVLLNAPPLLNYTDGAVISRVAGSTAVMVQAGKDRAIDLERALIALQNVRVEPLGLVLVGARAHVGDVGGLRRPGVRQRPAPRGQWHGVELEGSSSEQGATGDMAARQHES